MSGLELPIIQATSPTLAESMRVCYLRAGLSKAKGISPYILGNPKGWLGSAYHEVLEKLPDVDLEKESIDGAVDRLFNHAVQAQHKRNLEHSLDRRFGAPVTWPGYYVARESVLLRARELARTTPKVDAVGPSVQTTVAVIRERELSAFDGHLVGRPDIIRGHEVLDYKSGTIVEFDEVAQSDVVKAAYVRQLRIYGFLVKETFGWWPTHGYLLPLAGASVEVRLDPDECSHEAAEAVALMQGYNKKVSSGAAVKEFASPSAKHCQWCPYKLLCEPFWQIASPEWSDQLDGTTVEGVVVDVPSAIYAGAAKALSLDVERGNIAPCRTQITPLNPVTQPVVNSLSSGERIRVIGLRTRRDGILVPSERTVLCRADALPTVSNSRSVMGQ